MTFERLIQIQGHWFLKCCKNGEIHYSLVMTPMPCRVAWCIISIRPTNSCARALNYLLTYLFIYLHRWLWTYKNSNISETVEDKEKAIIKSPYKIVHWLLIAARMYDLEWPMSESQGHSFLNAAKMTKWQKCRLIMTPTPCRVAGCIVSVKRTYLCAGALTYLLTYTE